LIRKLSNKFKESGEENNDFTKFARGNRHSVAAHQSQYNDKCQTIFENQIRALSDPTPPYSDDEDDDDGGTINLKFAGFGPVLTLQFRRFGRLGEGFGV